MKHWKIAGLLSLLVVGGFLFQIEGESSAMSRTDCVDISLFAMPSDKSAEELCRNYGGVAKPQASLSDEALVILVRNKPVGGFKGETTD